MHCGTEACGPTRTFTPPVDAWETPTGYELRLDVPGATAAGVNVHAAHGQLHVEAKVAPRTFEGAQPLAAEYGVGDFHRAFALGEDVATDGIAATLKDGVLAVHLPKRPETLPRRVAVAAG